MTAISKKVKMVFVLMLLGMLALVITVNFTEFCTLEAVTVDGRHMEKWNKESPLIQDKSILRQPLEEFEVSSWADEKTLKLDYKYAWPHTLNVKLNSISPECFLLDRNSAVLYGLDANGRVFPLKPNVVDWERPVLTGISIRKLYQCPSDVRLFEVLPALDQLRSEKANFFRLIEQVDFGSDDFIEVAIAGHEHAVRVRADRFYDDINRYVDFVAKYHQQLEEIKVIDLRQDGQIVTKGKKA